MIHVVMRTSLFITTVVRTMPCQQFLLESLVATTVLNNTVRSILEGKKSCVASVMLLGAPDPNKF